MLLLDEPLGALDLKLREQMQVELKALQRQVGITFIYVTHDQGEALSMSDRVAVFNDGRIEQIGTPAEIYEHPATAFVAGFVGASNVVDAATAGRLCGRARAVLAAAGEASGSSHQAQRAPRCGGRPQRRGHRGQRAVSSAPARGSRSRSMAAAC